MSLPSLSVRRPTAVSMFFIAVALIGIIALRLLPVEMMPNTSFGDITINIDVRGGIPASEVERRIAIPTEEAVSSVSHLKNTLSISKEGNATVILEFEPGTNMDFAALEVREKFNRIRNKLPPEIEKPIIAKYEYMDVPIMILAVTSDIRSPEELRKIVDEKIKDRIQRIEGVARAEVAGGRERKILVEVDQYKLQAYGLAINRVVDTININNANLLAGEIKRVKDKYLVRTIGEFQNLDEIRDLAIATTKEGSVVRLRDVAEIKDSYLEPVAYARLNAQPVVSIYVQKESTANTVKISNLINKELKKLRPILEKDINVTPTFNQAETIQQAVNQVQRSLGIGAVLAFLILFVFLRSLNINLIIAVSIPLSILCTFSLMFFSKLTLNVMTLSGLALGVGMLVDCAIVVLDNILKKRDALLNDKDKLAQIFLENKAKETVKELAISGADEMFLAITASTFTTIIIFLPLVFINPEIRMLYSGIALTITYSLLASLLAALTLVPMLAARLKIKVPAAQTEDALTSQTKIPAAQPLPLFVAGKFETFYKKAVSVCLSLRYIIILLVILGSLYALREYKKLEKEFIGIAEQNKFTIFIELPTGTKLEISDKVVAQVEKYISGLPQIKNATSKVEPWSSKIYVELLPLSKRKKPTAQIINELRPFTDNLDPAFIYYEESEEIGTKEILIELYGYDYDVLKGLAVETAQRMQSIPDFTDTKIRMREGRPEMHLNINKRQAAMSGMSVEDIALALHTYMRGLVATRYGGKDKTEGEETETIVRLEEKYRRNFEDLRRIGLINYKGEQIYLSQVADLKSGIGPSEIWRKNKARMVQVSANTGGLALGTAADKVKEALKESKFPNDYFWQFGGNYDKMIRNQRELGFALILSLILVYMILASLFESFSQPFIILMTVPLAAIGAVIALRLADIPVGTGVLIGAIMLGGIVVNNAIVLVDRVNFLRRKHPVDYPTKKGIQEAMVIASYDRLRPIMMTSLTTILGLIPMALDKSESSSLWSPLAITVIGGLTLSTFLTLFVIPCIYLAFKDLQLIREVL
ncbi:MAG: efflux RND transporter permease subunit [Candidatus Omnitrophica bacterium]|nr:efflux RND transporter permease subunit [Candidatus Omnitrophota bacterium]MDD5592068.1 efflux RND transporter permease subunit [Candidatus Omnitrophota bacterium]